MKRTPTLNSKETTVNVIVNARVRMSTPYDLGGNMLVSFVALLIALILMIGQAQPANAATLCVNPSGTQGCSKTISAAVAAAAPDDTINVWAGTYSEYVVVPKPLHIIGADPNTTIVDAGGLPNGFNVDGLNNPGLANVSIRNFTVQNANFEGIVATNTSFIDISNNIVINNNRSLNNGQCPGLPAWETAEGFDCGEGIHLDAVDHSVVVSNVSSGNAGGILLSDETGVLHDNLIARNNVHDNPFDCGITLASHPPFNHDGPYGIMHNTIYNNTSSHNGNEGEGAGVGIFSPIPGGTNSGNVVVRNILTDNGQPGVAMHGHAPGQELSDNLIADNTLVNNAKDTADAATPGPTGINLFSVSPSRGTVVALNNFDKEQVDIVAHNPGEVFATLNNLTAYGLRLGVLSFGGGLTNATSNWWGCPDGPNQGSCSRAVSANSGSLLTNPWLSSQYTSTSAPKNK
jgi:hypothetical protein